MCNEKQKNYREKFDGKRLANEEYSDSLNFVIDSSYLALNCAVRLNQILKLTYLWPNFDLEMAHEKE